MKDVSLVEFIGLLSTMEMRVDHENQKALEKIGGIVEDESKRVIGTYEYGWPQLAPSTLKKKAANTPLLETGDMRDSIGHKVGHNEVTIGTDSEIAVYQELGTSRIPPRSFLREAAVRKTEKALDLIGRHVVGAISGTNVEVND